MLKCCDVTISQLSRLFTEVPETMRTMAGGVAKKMQLLVTREKMLTSLLLPLKHTLPRWRMAARSLKISQVSVSENKRIFKAARKWEYSIRSSRPSQLVQLPWWNGYICDSQAMKSSKKSKQRQSFVFFLENSHYHDQILVISSFAEGKNLFLLCSHARQHVVEDMVVSFLRCLFIKFSTCPLAQRMGPVTYIFTTSINWSIPSPGE